MVIKTPRIMIVGTGSGCGKTTVTCALLKLFSANNFNAISFKSGPDYIDPMFHSKVLNTPSSNLDLFLLNEQNLLNIFFNNAFDKDIALIEGAMGIYDGKGFNDDTYSANHLSKITKTPQILVVDARGKSVSLLAEIYGFLTYKKNNIKAIVLNNCSHSMYEIYKNMIEKNFSIKVVGYLPKMQEVSIASRHLGLITANEILDIDKKMNLLLKTATHTFKINEILNIANGSENIYFDYIDIKKITINTPRIAVAMDNAFCFYYKDSLNLLEKLGAKLVYFSPLNDNYLPENISGIILGGGYPEVYAEKLSYNKTMRLSIKNAVNRKVPIFAECGGFIYLGKTIELNNKVYDFCNVIDANFYMTEKLVRFGYSTLFSKHKNMLMNENDHIPCHEFHYSNADFCGRDLLSKKSETRIFDCGICYENIFALYPHIHFFSNLDFAKNFIMCCDSYKTTS